MRHFALWANLLRIPPCTFTSIYGRVVVLAGVDAARVRTDWDLRHVHFWQT